MKSIGLAALGVALISATAASAQTTVTREISSMPVETTITRSPEGMVVERRVLPSSTETVVAPAQSVSRTVTTTVRSSANARRPVARPTRIETRVVTTRRTRSPAPVYAMATAGPLALSADQRDVVYREIAQRTVVAQPAGPTGVLAPFSPLLPPAPAVTYTQPVVTTVPAPVRTTYVVGSRLPPDVRLIEMPETVVSQVPAVSPYAYVTVDGRVLLVDPQTGIIAADITN